MKIKDADKIVHFADDIDAVGFHVMGHCALVTIPKSLYAYRQAMQGNVMSRGPRGEKRPTDVIGNAVHVMRIATGETEESFPPDDGKNKAAQELGRRGGKARAAALGKKRRKEIAKKAAKARWSPSS